MEHIFSVKAKEIWFFFTIKDVTNKDLLHSTWNSVQCYVTAWTGEEFGGEWMHVYVWLSPFFFFFFSDSFIWNYQDIVNQLYPNTIKSLTEKIWLQSPLRRGSLEVGEWGHLPAHSAQLEMWNYMWLSWIASHDFNLFDLGMNFLQKTWLFLFLKTPQLC